jgi:hypothetical protein
MRSIPEAILFAKEHRAQLIAFYVVLSELGYTYLAETMTGKVKKALDSMPDRSILQFRKYVTVLTPSTLVSKQGVLNPRERKSVQSGEVV